MKGWRKCKNCGKEFEKKRTLQSVCTPTCAFEYQKKLKEKKEAREWKERKRKMKEKLTTTSDYKKILQVIINQIVRKIDHNQNCISCGKPPKKENPNKPQNYPKPRPTPTPPFIPQSSGGGTGSVVTNNQTVPRNYNPRDYGDIVLGSVDRGRNIRR